MKQETQKLHVKNAKKRVFDIVADKLNLNPAELKDDDTYESLGADSLEVVEMVMEYEKEFNVAIPDEDVYDNLGKSTLINTVLYIEKNA